MKQITTEQINAVLQVIYQTNISAQQFDAVKKMFADLPVLEDKKKRKSKNESGL